VDKKLLAVAVSSALAAPMAAQAVDFKTSGHINRQIRFADDGVASDVQFTDVTHSRSRVRFVGSSDIGNGMKAGVNLEIGFASNRQFGGATSPVIKSADGGDSVGDIRHSALWFSGTWGKVHLGHTSSAADGMTGADLRGTWMGDSATAYNSCPSCAVRTSGGGSVGTLGTYHATFDGGRMDVLRYDSPKLGPAQIRVNVANNDRWEAAAYVNSDFGGGALSLAAGYISSDNRTGRTRQAISGAFRFSQGTSIAMRYSEQDPTVGASRDDFWASIGHRWGANAVSVSYGNTDQGGGTEGTRWGIGWQHELKNAGVSLYAGYNSFDNEATGVSLEDFNMFRVGTRVKFK